jgi:hypothetical protein
VNGLSKLTIKIKLAASWLVIMGIYFAFCAFKYASYIPLDSPNWKLNEGMVVLIGGGVGYAFAAIISLLIAYYLLKLEHYAYQSALIILVPLTVVSGYLFAVTIKDFWLPEIAMSNVYLVASGLSLYLLHSDRNMFTGRKVGSWLIILTILSLVIYLASNMVLPIWFRPYINSDPFPY